jgi:hypothetical protein
MGVSQPFVVANSARFLNKEAYGVLNPTSNTRLSMREEIARGEYYTRGPQ